MSGATYTSRANYPLDKPIFRVTTFAFWDFAVAKKKAVGGVVLSVIAKENRLRLVNKIISSGHSQPILMVTGTKSKAIYSETERARWNIEILLIGNLLIKYSYSTRSLPLMVFIILRNYLLILPTA